MCTICNCQGLARYLSGVILKMKYLFKSVIRVSNVDLMELFFVSFSPVNYNCEMSLIWIK